MDGLEVDVFGPNSAGVEVAGAVSAVTTRIKVVLDSEGQQEYTSPISGRR